MNQFCFNDSTFLNFLHSTILSVVTFFFQDELQEEQEELEEEFPKEPQVVHESESDERQEEEDRLNALSQKIALENLQKKYKL